MAPNCGRFRVTWKAASVRIRALFTESSTSVTPPSRGLEQRRGLSAHATALHRRNHTRRVCALSTNGECRLNFVQSLCGVQFIAIEKQSLERSGLCQDTSLL